MCNAGDIILVESYRHGERTLTRHSFVVISTESGTIGGLDYDFVCNVLSSYKNDAHKAKKSGYPGNFEITPKDETVSGGNRRDGYIKAEQLYYFNSEKTNYTVIGTLHQEVFERLIEFIESLKIPFEDITENL